MLRMLILFAFYYLSVSLSMDISAQQYTYFDNDAWGNSYNIPGLVNTGMVQMNTTTESINSKINGILPYKNGFIVYGQFNNYGKNIVLRNTNTEQWESLGTGVEGSVQHAIQIGDTLLLAGDFINTAKKKVYISAFNLVTKKQIEWNNDGLDSVISQPFASRNLSLCIHRGVIYVAGSFHTMSGEKMALARWSGNSWVTLVAPDPMALQGNVSHIISLNGKLYANGAFQAMGKDSIVRYTATWDGSKWSNVFDKINDEIQKSPMQYMLCDNRRILFAGGFRSFTPATMNTIIGNVIALYDGADRKSVV